MNDYQTYYVYSHVDPRNGEVVYIGMGTHSRAWVCGSYRRRKPTAKIYGHRSLAHDNWLQELLNTGYLPNDWVSIIERGLPKEEAMEREKEEIKIHKPKFNLLFNPDHSFSRWPEEIKAFAKNLRKGFNYSYTQISYLLGGDSLISRENKKIMSVWRMINGK